jgi:hypothetical protein
MGGRGARSAPFGVAMNPKRRVRAAHGRARARTRGQNPLVITIIGNMVTGNVKNQTQQYFFSIGEAISQGLEKIILDDLPETTKPHKVTLS